MHVLVINQYALPAGSAGITRHADIGGELVRRGHDVTVVASDYDYLRRRSGGSRQPSEITASGVRFLWFQTGSYSANDRSRVRSILRFTWKASWAAARLRPRPDVIIASSPHPLAGLAAGIASVTRRIPWVFEARDIWPAALVDLGAIRSGSLTHRGLEMVERFAYGSSRRVVFVPPHGERRLSELGMNARKAVHIPNGTNLTTDARPVPATLQKLLDRARGKFVLAYTGAMGVPNGMDTAIDGMERLRARDPAASDAAALLMIGGGVYRDTLIQQARERGLENVLFHQPIEKAAIGPVLAQADACLMQTSASAHFHYGLSPNKLFDYLAAARPILISADEPTIVDEVDAGIRYPPGDSEAFADAVLRLMRTPPAEREAMGQRGRELAQTRYSITAIADQYEHLLEEVIAERRR